MDATQVTQSEKGTDPDGSSSDDLGRDGAKAVRVLKRKPAIGVMLAGGAGILAASVIGVGEVAIAMAAGYAAYRVLTA